MLTLSRSAGHLPSPIHALKNSKLLTNPNISKISNHASTSSLKSDKSDSHLNSLSRDRCHNTGTNSGSSTLKSHGGLRDIFRVRLPRKKLSSPEAEILETLDSAIASGGVGGGGSNSSTQRKARRKRGSSRGAGGAGESSNKNGTWPRVMLNRNSACSYTLPHHSGEQASGTENVASSDGNRASDNHYASLNPPHRKKSDTSSGFYSGGHYIPNTNTSNTVGARRHNGGGGAKERLPLSSLPWDMTMGGAGVNSNSNSVGAININGGGSQLQLHKNNPNLMGQSHRGNIETDKSMLTRSRPGFLDSVNNSHDIGAGLILSQGGPGDRIHSGQPPHHRYSFGVFDPSNSKTGKL